MVYADQTIIFPGSKAALLSVASDIDPVGLATSLTVRWGPARILHTGRAYRDLNVENRVVGGLFLRLKESTHADRVPRGPVGI